MNREKYLKIVDEITPKENRLKDTIVAFLFGGMLGVFAQGLTDLYIFLFDISSKDAGVYMILTLIVLSSLFTALGFFDDIISFAKAGIIVPITGFAHAMTAAALDYKNEGLVTGIGSNIFKLTGSVLLYGITSAFFVSLIRWWLNI